MRVLVLPEGRPLAVPTRGGVRAVLHHAALACGVPVAELALYCAERPLRPSATEPLPRGILRVAHRAPGGGTSDARSASFVDAFHDLDINGDGQISREEFVAWMTSAVAGCSTMGKEEAETVFRRFDINGDGTVDLKEFVAAWEPPHQPPARNVPIRERWRWETHGGGEIESVLSSGAIALLDAQWIINLADSGGVLKPRQALPDEAFLSLSEVQAATCANASSLPIVCISHCWLQPDHPDPRGHNLRIVARTLKSLLAAEKGRRHAVFYDFCCIHQCCRDDRGVPQGSTFKWLPDERRLERGAIGRFASEHGLFKRALGALCALYSHPATIVLMLTAFPPDYKDKGRYTLSGNTHPYLDRGWCFCESSWAMMVKANGLALDLGPLSGKEDMEWGELCRACTQGRRAPALPSDFEAQLKGKAFTNGKTDLPLVAELYKNGFTNRFGAATVLQYSQMGWGDAEAKTLGALIGAGTCSNLTKLHLGGNLIGDHGAAGLAKGLACTPLLKELVLTGNAIGNDGASALANSLALVPNMERIHLDSNRSGPAGACALARSLSNIAGLEWFYMSGNPIGDEGARALAKGLQDTPAVEWLYLSGCSIGDDGMYALACSLPSVPSLEWLDLDGNHIGDAGVGALAERLEHVPALERLYLRNNKIGNAGGSALAGKLASVPMLRWLYLEGNAITDEAVIQETMISAWGRRGSGLSL